MYKLDNEDQVVREGRRADWDREILPLPLFNRQTHAITAATASGRDGAVQELTSRTLSVRHEVAAAYAWPPSDSPDSIRVQRAVYGYVRTATTSLRWPVVFAQTGELLKNLRFQPSKGAGLRGG